MRININEIKNSVYIMPFTAESVLMYHILKNNNVNVLGFCDNKSTIHGECYDNCEIISPVSAYAQTPDAGVILCSFRHYSDNIDQLNKVGFKNIVKIEYLLTESDMAEAIGQIDAVHFGKIAPRQMLRLKRLPYEIKDVILPENVLTEDAVVINSATVFITEKCTLKCRGCIALMQYYTNPEHIELHELCYNIDVLMEKVDFIRSLRIIGGEPMIYPALPEVLAHMKKYKNKYGLLRIITNGTVVPAHKSLCAMKEANAFVKISDYGELSVRLEGLIKSLEEYKIAYQIDKSEWYAMRQLINDATINDAQTIFSKCLSKQLCNGLKNGRLYLCAFLAYGEALGVFPYDEKNHLNLLDSSVTKYDVANFFKSEQAPPGCAYCSGDDRNLPVIPRAEQVSIPLKYTKFS